MALTHLLKHTFLLIIVGLSLGATAIAEPTYQDGYIFPPAEPNGMHVHASAIVVCPDGDLLACWYANGDELTDPRFYTEDRDKHDNVRIMGSRKVKGSDEWEEPFVMNDTFGTSDNNPTMAIDHEGRLWLFHTTMLAAPEWTWSGSIIQYKISSDYDAPGTPTWSKSSLLMPRPSGLDKVLNGVEEALKDPQFEQKYGATVEQARPFVKVLQQRMGEVRYQRIGWMPRTHPIIRADGNSSCPSRTRTSTSP